MKKQFWSGVFTGMIVMTLVFFLGLGVNRITSGSLFENLNIGADGEEAGEGWSISQEDIHKINVIKDYIDRNFLDEVDKDRVSEGIFRGLLSGLDDPYSVYFTAEEYKSLMEDVSGLYRGIGAVVTQDAKTGLITIVRPFVDGPAYLAGILPGDVIVKVEGEEVAGKDLSEVVAKLKGEEGTFVNVEMMRENEKENLSFLIERKEIEVPTIAHEMLDGGIGYIAISGFEEVTAEQFNHALEELEEKGMQGLVIDLRNNGGGSLATVVDMLDRILPEGLIVYTVDKDGVDNEYHSSAKWQFEKPLAVLINENSASASEVFAGAVQDYGIGTLVGVTSFGKGIVQTILPLRELGDGSAIKLTTSKYFTPKGRNIHGTGIEPDVEVELAEELKKQVVIKKEDDSQLQKAVEVVKEKIR